MRTAQEPHALRLGCFRENLHAFALAILDIIFLTLFKLDRLCVGWEVHMPIRRVEAFLYKQKTIFRELIHFGVDEYIEMGLLLTGRTIRSGFSCAPPTPSQLAALRIISLACFRLALLSAPIWPSWIRARLNGLNAGADGMVDMDATPLRVTGRTRIRCERRDSNNVRPRQESMIMILKTRLEVLLGPADSSNGGVGGPHASVYSA